MYGCVTTLEIIECNKDLLNGVAKLVNVVRKLLFNLVSKIIEHGGETIQWGYLLACLTSFNSWCFLNEWELCH